MMTTVQQLKEYLTKLAHGGLCVAFSGGVDSALLLKATCEATAGSGAPKVHAVTMYTPFHSPLEREEAARMAESYGALHTVIAMENMPDAVLRNPPDRCYLCKRTIFESLRKYADEHSLAHVVDGTNADDLGEYRPGLRALGELDIRSPLAELGLRKADVRALAAEMGLTVASKPSAPCLATRIPYDTAITPEALRGAEIMERAVKDLGIGVVRARIHGDTVRLEVSPDDFGIVVAARDSLLAALHTAGFDRLTLDLAGYRSGSFDGPHRDKEH